MTAVGGFSSPVYAVTTAASGWQLPAGNYEPSPYPMEIIAPRPDNIRTAESRYSWAYPGIEYRVPICVLFGAYPFLYELVSTGGTADTSGATLLGQRQYNTGSAWYETEDWRQYGVLRWTPAPGDDGETFSFTVRVTSQTGEQQTVTWSGTVSAAKFFFVDSEAGTNGDGTLTNPFNTMTGLWEDANAGGSPNAQTDRIMYLRGRATPYTGVGFAELRYGPRVWLGFPGDSMPLYDGAAHPTWLHGSQSDAFFAGLKIIKLNDTAPSAYFIKAFGQQHRFTFWENYCTGGRRGTNGQENPSYYQSVSLQTAYRDDTVFKNNIWEDSVNAGNQSWDMRAFTLYGHDRVLIEGDVVRDNWASQRLYIVKGIAKNVCYRAIYDFAGYQSGVSRFWNMQGLDGTASTELIPSINFEVCWCWTYNVSFGGGYQPQTAHLEHGPNHVYRNTFYSTGTGYGVGYSLSLISNYSWESGLRFTEGWHFFKKNVAEAGQGPWYSQYNNGTNNVYLYFKDDAEVKATWVNGTFQNNLTAVPAGTLFDSAGNLLQSQAQWRGTRGAEIWT